ncbi:hypothetical protein FKM82_014304 [Ascaphus truei]
MLLVEPFSLNCKAYTAFVRLPMDVKRMPVCRKRREIATVLRNVQEALIFVRVVLIFVKNCHTVNKGVYNKSYHQITNVTIMKLTLSLPGRMASHCTAMSRNPLFEVKGL